MFSKDIEAMLNKNNGFRAFSTKALLVDMFIRVLHILINQVDAD